MALLELTLQTGLLGLAIALILALVTALVGPLLIDWGTYRTLFETEASRLAGVKVSVTGPIDARLLPSPRITLHDISIGDGKDTIRAHSLGIEFALGPLLQGIVRADELKLDGPEVALNLDAAGRVQVPNISVAFNPDALSIDRLSIENGKVVLADTANGARVTLDSFRFTGEARSLLGPFKGEGAAAIAGELYPYRVSASRYDGTFKIRLNVDPVNRPLSIKADGVLAFSGAAPRFNGNLMLTRSAGIAAGADQLTEPWRIGGKIKATAQSALMENVEFQYGSEEQGFKLTGVTNFEFGKHPRFESVLSGHQFDLDRMLTTSKDVGSPPGADLRQLAKIADAAFHPAFPFRLGVSLDQVTFGGSMLQNLRGDISSDAHGWNLDKLEFRAPGFTQVGLSGRLATDRGPATFKGPVQITATNPEIFIAWLEGRDDPERRGLRPVNLRGDITFGNEEIVVQKLNAEFDHKNIFGELTYRFARANKPSKLDAALQAPDLDIDAVVNFGNVLFRGSNTERPHDMTIAADVGRATLGAFVGRNASIRLKADGAGLQLDKLSVADFGGAAFLASGRITTGSASPQGDIRVDLDAPDIMPVVALISRFAPETAQSIGRRASALSPAKLHAQLVLQPAKPSALAKLVVGGHLGRARVVWNGRADVDADTFNVGAVHMNGKLDTDDGQPLLSMLGLDHVIAVGAGPGVLTVAADGPARGDLRVESKLIAGGLEASVNGTANFFREKPSFAINTNIAHADVAPLRPHGDARGALLVSYSSHVVLADRKLTLSKVNAKIGDARLNGRLSVSLKEPRSVNGEVDIDNVGAANIDGASFVAAAIGMPVAPTKAGAAWSWSNEPFAGNVFDGYAGTVSLKAARINLLPGLPARQFHVALHFSKDGFAFDDMTGTLAGGKIAGALSFQQGEDGLKTRAKILLKEADAAKVFSSGERTPITGPFVFEVELEGAGLSPVALIGSLQGKGKVMLTKASFADLNPRAFDAAIHAVDGGGSVDASRVSDVVRKVLGSGQFYVNRAGSEIDIGAGQVRINNADITSPDAGLSFSGTLDLTDGLIDTRLALSGLKEAAGARPEIYIALKGPIEAPSRTVDVSALTGWLTLRAVENQAKQIEKLERTPRKAGGSSPPEDVPTASLPPAMTPVSQTSNQFSPLSRSDPAPERQSMTAPELPPPITIVPLPRPRLKPTVKSYRAAPPKTLVGAQQ